MIFLGKTKPKNIGNGGNKLWNYGIVGAESKMMTADEFLGENYREMDESSDFCRQLALSL